MLNHNRKQMKKISLLTLATLAFACFAANAARRYENAAPRAIGVYVGVNLNMHSPNFAYLFPDKSAALFKSNGIGAGLDFGFSGLTPLDSALILAGYVGYNNLSGILTSEKTSGGTYKLDASVNYVEISAALQYRGKLPVESSYLFGGLELGIPLSPKYNIDLGDSSIIANESITSPLLRFGAILGAGYQIELENGSLLTPELSLRLPFNFVSTEKSFSQWSVPQLRLSASLNFSLEKPLEVKIEKSKNLKVRIKGLRYFDKDGNPIPLDKIKVEEVKYVEQFPLLPYVFCSKESEKPSPKAQTLLAKTEAGEFAINSLKDDALAINSRTLDIVGARMRKFKNAILTITGTIDGVEEKNPELAFKRASFAKNYLTSNFGVSPQRIILRAVEKPEKPSAQNDSDGVEENRRIELSSSDPSILEPIVIEKEDRTFAEPNLIEFLPEIITDDSLTN